jgi:hypothetical protein
VKLLSATLDGLVINRPEPTQEQPQHACLAAAYDSTPVYKELLAQHYLPHVRSRGEEKREKEIILGYRARRRVVDAPIPSSIVHADFWFALEKKSEKYLALLHVACAQLIFARLSVLQKIFIVSLGSKELPPEAELVLSHICMLQSGISIHDHCPLWLWVGHTLVLGFS